MTVQVRAYDLLRMFGCGQMIKYATALRLRTAESHQMLRRFTAPSGGGSGLGLEFGRIRR
ncbi:hypothetical protein [Rhizohabitans arisaemae]|uniref:hypothetical protein n=1 Tax=Rhizohabitans arisaemae TaxID=2720610 RepID=UPI0024B27A57|nr:hypothetical protein [Rhizohabitans arisaemae]